MPAAYYNEIDKFAAQWLRNLIEAGHIAPGYVDERSISDIKPSDLAGYSQVHFFAGIGVWSLALRRAGWPDDRPVWTGSCPCQPFSSAGAGAGFADERHLWPHFHWLIEQCRPPTVLGEQVASKDAEPWIDLVQTDLEAMGYAFGAIAFPASCVGAPHIRDRLYWMADSKSTGKLGVIRGAGGSSTVELRTQQEWPEYECSCGLGVLAHASGQGLEKRERVSGILGEPTRTEKRQALKRGSVCTTVRLANNNEHGCAALPLDRCHYEEHHTEPCCELCGMGDTNSERAWRDSRGLCGAVKSQDRELCADHAGASGSDGGMGHSFSAGRQPITDGQRSNGAGMEKTGSLAEQSSKAGVHADWMADAECQQREECIPRPGQSDCAQGNGQTVEPTGLCLSCSRPSPTNGFWRDADWLLCRDGKWRPVEPGTFPLAHGAPARVGRLRAYGNAINAQAAQVFIEAAMSCIET